MKWILLALVLGITVQEAQAQSLPMPELPALDAYSGSFRLLSAMSLQEGTVNYFSAEFTKKDQNDTRHCRLLGTVWSLPLTGYGPKPLRQVLDVPGTMQVECPGQAPVTVFGSFARLSTQRGWNPVQTERCLKLEYPQGSGKRATCAQFGTEVAAGVTGRWVTWQTTRIPNANTSSLP